MKKIIRLTESELHNIIKNTVKTILKEDVLGNDWRENELDSVMNNYEPFEAQEDVQDHNWSGAGEEEFDPTNYDNFSDDIVNGDDWAQDRIDIEANYDDFPPIR